MEQVIAGDIHRMTEVQQRMEYGHGFVPGHVDFIEDPEAAFYRALVHGTGAEFHFSVFKGIGSQHPGGIHIDVEGHVPHGPSEHRRQVFRQHVLPGGLGAGQQQVLPAQQGGNGLFPHVFAIIMEVRDGDPGLEFRRRGEFFPIGLQSPEQVRIDMFTL